MADIDTRDIRLDGSVEITLDLYKLMLKQCDWHYARSDDRSAYRRGKDHYDRVQALRKKGPEYEEAYQEARAS